jgi:hypothetical protein
MATPLSHHVQMLMEGGFSQPYAETIEDMLNAYYMNAEIFDERYWEYRLLRAGATQEQVEALFLLLHDKKARKRFLENR